MKTLILLLASFGAFAGSKDVDLLWKARSLQAVERGEEIVAALDKVDPKKKEQLFCELVGERAYMPFSVPETSKVATQKSGKDTWRILYFSIEDKSIQLSLLYGGDKHSIDGWKVPQMDPAWQVSAMKGTDTVAILHDRCILIFNLDNPLKVSASAVKK